MNLSLSLSFLILLCTVIYNYKETFLLHLKNIHNYIINSIIYLLRYT